MLPSEARVGGSRVRVEKARNLPGVNVTETGSMRRISTGRVSFGENNGFPACSCLFTTDVYLQHLVT